MMRESPNTPGPRNIEELLQFINEPQSLEQGTINTIRALCRGAGFTEAPAGLAVMGTFNGKKTMAMAVCENKLIVVTVYGGAYYEIGTIVDDVRADAEQWNPEQRTKATRYSPNDEALFRHIALSKAAEEVIRKAAEWKKKQQPAVDKNIGSLRKIWKRLFG